jgi:golgin subfamily B member 1
VLEKQLDVVTTEREKIECSCTSRRSTRSTSSRRTSRRSASSRCSRSIRTNEEAYFKLERNYRKLRQWLDLINTYDRHIAATLERKTKVELYGAIAQVYADEVEDAERAIDAYKNIVDLDEQNVPALEALAKLYEKPATPRSRSTS